MSLTGRLNQRGDTIVEVMFAFAVFAAVATGAFLLANQATATLQQSLEITLVREQIDAQSELLRFLNQSYAVTAATGATVAALESGSPAERWKYITQTKSVPQASAFGDDAVGSQSAATSCPAKPIAGFTINPTNVRVSENFAQADIFAEVQGAQSRGIWVEAVPQPASQRSAAATYIDFHVRACWMAAGSSKPVTLGTVVRLYEPAS